MTLPVAFASWLRLVGQGLSLSVLRAPRSRIELASFGDFIACSLLASACYAAQDFLLTEPPAQFDPDSAAVHASFLLSLLAITWMQTRLLARPALWLNLAALVGLAGIPMTAVWNQLPSWFPQAEPLQLGAWKLLLGTMGLALMVRIVSFLAAGSGAARIMGAAVLGWALLAWPWQARQQAWLWSSIDQEGEEVEAAPAAVVPPSFDPHVVTEHQEQLLQQAIAALQPQDRARIDLYSIGFAGDGSESAFRNEVEYLARLMAQRFKGHGHTLSLINHPDSVKTTPLATLDNFQAALKGVAAHMDPKQDILFVYLTSHGSRNHQLLVDLDPIAMTQITAGDLRNALDDAGIGWRVLVVSACYSGGFVDELADDRTLVITAARRDRSSFGCGADSEITWFGRAFLVDALNQTTDMKQAFAIASRQVREWELKNGNTPSVPQMREGSLIGAHLDQWRKQLPDGDALPFTVAGSFAPMEKR